MPRSVFVFWDNSNIFISAKTVARGFEGDSAYYQIRIDFDHMMQLARANRPLEYALAVGSVPPPMRHVWNRMEQAGVQVELFERGTESQREQAVDQALQVQMLRKAFDYNGNPGIAVVLTGDGQGFMDGVGFHADLDRMHARGWGVEVIAWEQTCNPRMREWARNVGEFIALEDYYHSVTFTEEDNKPIRYARPVDLSGRRMVP